MYEIFTTEIVQPHIHVFRETMPSKRPISHSITLNYNRFRPFILNSSDIWHRMILHHIRGMRLAQGYGYRCMLHTECDTFDVFTSITSHLYLPINFSLKISFNKKKLGRSTLQLVKIFNKKKMHNFIFFLHFRNHI